MHDSPVLVVDPGMHTASIGCAAKDHAGKWAVTGSLDKTVRVWSIADGELLRTIRMPAGPGRVGHIYNVAMSPDGSLIAAGGWTRWTDNDKQQQIYLIDRATGNIVHLIENLPDVTSALLFSPDGNLLATILQTGGLKIYSCKQNWLEIGLDASHPGKLASMAFTRNGLVTTAYDQGVGVIKIYFAPLIGDLKPRRTIAMPGGLIPTGVAAKPEGLLFTSNQWARDKFRLAVGFGNEPVVGLFDDQTLSPTMREWSPNLSELTNGDLGTVAWSHEGETLYAAGTFAIGPRKAIVRWNFDPEGERDFLPAWFNTVRSIINLLPRDLLVATSDPCFARLREDGVRRWEHLSPKADFRGQCRTLGVSFDGCVIDFCYDRFTNKQMRFDMSSRVLVEKIAIDHVTNMPCIDNLPISNWENLDGPVIFGDKNLNLFQFERSHSLSIHQSDNRFVIGTDYYLRAYDAEGNAQWIQPVPEAIWAVNISGDGRLVIAACGDGTIRWYRASDGVELLAFMPQRDRTNWIAWTPEGFYGASAGAHGVLRWHVNRGWDKPADSIAIERIARLRRPEILLLVLKELDIVRALGVAELTEARRQIVLHTNSRVPPGTRLHVLTIGVSSYNKNRAAHLQLRYADKDAKDLASAIINTQNNLYSQILSNVLCDKQATKENIISYIKKMQVENEWSFGNDLVILYFSGHGTLIDGNFYLLPYDVDARDMSGIASTGLSIEEVNAELLALAARGRVLVLLDACHSGATTLGGIVLDADSTGIRYRLAAANITVITSSSGQELSREDPAWGHGAFTKVLLDAFNDPEADLDRNGLISVSGLARYLLKRVPVITDGAQTPGIEVRYDGTLFAANC